MTFKPVVNDKSNFEILKKLTDRLDFSNCIQQINATTIEMTTEKGRFQLLGLLNIEPISVARCIIDENTETQIHTHEQMEIIIVYSGNVMILDDGQIYELKQGEIRYIVPGSPHMKCTQNEKCELISITLPQSVDFPNSK